MKFLHSKKNTSRFVLEGTDGLKAKGNSAQVKHYCSHCQKTKKWVRYIDTETREYLPIEFGRCDSGNFTNSPYHDKAFLRSYHNTNAKHPPYLPYTGRKTKSNLYTPPPAPNPTKAVYFDFETFKQTLNPNNYAANQFITNLRQNVQFPFLETDIQAVIRLYFLGTVPPNLSRYGGTTFPLIDFAGNIHTVQVRSYDSRNHGTHTNFLHSLLLRKHEREGSQPPQWLSDYIAGGKFVGCLFGEHLLSLYPNAPVCLVEAPKTAVIATLYYGLPNDTQDSPPLWLATYSKGCFTLDRLKILKGRQVTVYPDLSTGGKTFKEWQDKAQDFERQISGLKFEFSTQLETIAGESEKEKGQDLADFLIKLNWQDFRQPPPADSFSISIPPAEPEPDFTPPPPLRSEFEPLIQLFISDNVVQPANILRQKLGDSLYFKAKDNGILQHLGRAFYTLSEQGQATLGIR